MIFPPVDNNGGNVSVLPVKPRTSPDASLSVVHSYDCRHGKFRVDEKKAEVECGICHEKLNPIWVLGRIAEDDDRLRSRWAELRAEVELMKPRLSTKCTHCGKLTPIPTNVKSDDLRRRASEIKRGEP